MVVFFCGWKVNGDLVQMWLKTEARGLPISKSLHYVLKVMLHSGIILRKMAICSTSLPDKDGSTEKALPCSVCDENDSNPRRGRSLSVALSLPPGRHSPPGRWEGTGFVGA